MHQHHFGVTKIKLETFSFVFLPSFLIINQEMFKLIKKDKQTADEEWLSVLKSKFINYIPT
jgi:hypothetical protein